MTDPEKVTTPSEFQTPETSEEPRTESPATEPVESVATSIVDPGVTTTYRGRRSAAAKPTEDVPSDAEAVAPEESVTESATVETRAKTAPRTKPAATPDDSSSQYAVIATGGKQYRVKVGDRIQVERLHAEAGSDLTIDQVLLLGGAGSTRIGTPIVDGASVTAHIDEHGRGEKIVVFKFKAKKRYRRRTGHRQELTRLTITGISG